jgi:HEAT repeat protein
MVEWTIASLCRYNIFIFFSPVSSRLAFHPLSFTSLISHFFLSNHHTFNISFNLSAGLNNAIGSKVASLALPQIGQFVADDDWRRRHAGLMALSQVGEHLALDAIPWPLILSIAREDTHPRVRYAAIDVIGQLATDLSPVLQTHLHDTVVPCLCAALVGSATALVTFICVLCTLRAQISR